MIYNLRKFTGNFKGIIGECMFKMTNKKVVITKFFNNQKYERIFGRYFNLEQLNFIKENWYSLDAIEINFQNKIKQIILYEIKTKNKYKKELYFKPKMTFSTHKIYEKAKEMGFIVKLVFVEFNQNWEYAIKILDFKEKYYCIDRPKKYDKFKS